MLDMSWGEVMLIGGVALIVIGPKDLPKALRTLGQVTTKVRRMAGEFQHQFNEAIREAELDEIKRDVADVKRKAESFKPSFNPVDTIRNELKSAVEGREATKKSDLMEGTAPLAVARGSEGADEQLPLTGGSYDVPRDAPQPIEPAPEPMQGPVADPSAQSSVSAPASAPAKPDDGRRS